MIDFSDPFIVEIIKTLQFTATSIVGVMATQKFQKCCVKKNNMYNILGFAATVALAAYFRTQLQINPQPYVIMFAIGSAIQFGISLLETYVLKK